MPAILSDPPITALGFIKRALKVRKVLGPNETPSDDDSEDALTSLNAMLKTWSAKSVMVYQIRQEQWTLIANQPSYTIGPGGDFSTDRPDDIVGGWVREGTGEQDFSLGPVDRDRYDAIFLKGTTGRPSLLYYQPSVPLGVVYFHYVPDRAYLIALNSYLPLVRFATLTTPVSLPPEYEECIVYQLARRLTQFGGRMDPEDMTVASEAWQTVQSTNSRIPQVATEIGYAGYGAFDINSRTVQ